MSMVKGLYGSINGLEDLANEQIQGVQVPHSSLGGQTIESTESMPFNTVDEFVNRISDLGLEGEFEDADRAEFNASTGILTLSKNVGSNGNI